MGLWPSVTRVKRVVSTWAMPAHWWNERWLEAWYQVAKDTASRAGQLFQSQDGYVKGRGWEWWDCQHIARS